MVKVTVSKLRLWNKKKKSICRKNSNVFIYFLFEREGFFLFKKKQSVKILAESGSSLRRHCNYPSWCKGKSHYWAIMSQWQFSFVDKLSLRYQATLIISSSAKDTFYYSKPSLYFGYFPSHKPLRFTKNRHLNAQWMLTNTHYPSLRSKTKTKKRQLLKQWSPFRLKADIFRPVSCSTTNEFGH